MKRRDNGHIINISSIAVNEAYPGRGIHPILATGPIHELGLVKYGMQVKNPEPGLKAHQHLTLTALYPNHFVPNSLMMD
jgi:hypothetical protein